jgi:EAL domain-containing protein (putative c-di-GMP-specific phosphodiesterase class I)
VVDKYLHRESVKTFTEHDLNGFLFVNFVAGFIQRPEVYLEGLSSAVQEYSMSSKQVALDLTQSEESHDLMHLTSITDLCCRNGYVVALDDVTSFDGAIEMIEQMRPDFVKLDIKLVQDIMNNTSLNKAREIVKASHSVGALVIAEGVETEEMHTHFIKYRD